MSATAMSIKPLRVYIIEPQPLLGKALFRMVSDDDELVVAGESMTFNAAVLAQAHPDIILADWDEDFNAIADLVQGCRRVVPQVRICVLTAHLSAPQMMRAISAGVDGYVAKDVSPAELLACVKQVAVDGFYADPRLTKLLLRSRAKHEAVQLSKRELDVVRLVAEGLSNKEIAARLMLSDKTVKNHIANIFAKLDLTARTQIAVYAIRNGLL